MCCVAVKDLIFGEFSPVNLICLSVELPEVADRDGGCKTHSKLVQTGEWSERFVGSSSNTEELEKWGSRCWGESI